MSEISCETCGVSSPNNAHCRNCPGSYSSNNPYSQWQSKSASPIGETVLTDKEIEELFIEFTESGWINSIVIRLICQAQDAHTRKEVAKVIKARLVDDGMLFIREPQLQDWFEALIEELEGK
jgi:hypothetical protein